MAEFGRILHAAAGWEVITLKWGRLVSELFTRPGGLAATWDCLAPVLDARPEPLPYPRVSWGPAEADALAGPDGWLLGGG